MIFFLQEQKPMPLYEDSFNFKIYDVTIILNIYGEV